MIQTIRDCLVVCDIDNTLLNVKSGLPEVNRLTVDLFISHGGRFTVATGRTTESVQHHLKKLNLNAPIITYNGAVIYDLQKKKYLQNKILPEDTAMRALQEIQAAFPGIGIEVMAADGRLYVVQSNELTHHHTVYEQLVYTMSPLGEFSSKWNKVLFAASPVVLEQVRQFVDDKAYEEIYFVSTDKIYFEMMPEGASKGRALEELCAMMNIPVENTVVIGDYYNDIELMQTAGHAVAVENAPDSVKAVADAVTGRCEDGGVAQVLYELIRKYPDEVQPE